MNVSNNKFCVNCGARLAPGARFCEECGQPVQQTRPQPVQPPPAQAPRQPQPPPYAATLQEPAFSQEPPPAQSYPPSGRAPNPGPSKGLVALVVVAGVAALVVCVLVGIVAYKRFLGPGSARATATTSQQAANPSSPDTQPPAAAEQPVAVDQPVATEPPAEINQPAAEEPPAAPEPSSGLAYYEFAGISFSYDPSLATFMDTELFEANTGGDVPPWELMPQYTRLTLQGYPLSDTNQMPQIFVIPLAEYMDANPDVNAPLEDLQQMILAKRTNALPDQLPCFPLTYANQMIVSNVAYLDFQNGSGVRYLTQVGQGEYPINNQGLVYTFQGLSDDGMWLVSAVLPVSNAILPDPELVLADPKFTDDHLSYIVETRVQLEEQPDGSYLPDLALLDALFQTFLAK